MTAADPVAEAGIPWLGLHLKLSRAASDFDGTAQQAIRGRPSEPRQQVSRMRTTRVSHCHMTECSDSKPYI